MKLTQTMNSIKNDDFDKNLKTRSQVALLIPEINF